MEREEIGHIIAAILIFTAILAFGHVIDSDYGYLGMAFVSAAIIIVTNIFGKKAMAYMLDADVEHRIWVSNYKLTSKGPRELKRPFPTGIVLPLVLALVTLGYLKVAAFLNYETSAKKIRAAKRFGYYSYTEITEWHNALIGAAGIVVTLAVLVITYFSGFEPIAKAAALYAFWNMVPASKLDGTQIFFGSKILWTLLAILSTIAVLYSIALI
jgi:Zn-dependent protease